MLDKRKALPLIILGSMDDELNVHILVYDKVSLKYEYPPDKLGNWNVTYSQCTKI